jgi:hypothetical protein
MHAVARRLADAVERDDVPPSLLEVKLTGLQGIASALRCPAPTHWLCPDAASWWFRA